MKRRQFLHESSVIVAGAAMFQSPLSYSRIPGANDRVSVGIVGLNSRGSVLANVLLQLDGFEITALCDVDTRVFDPLISKIVAKQTTKPKTYKDFREMLKDDTIDAVVIATADHTHAPFAIYALNAGKHVYLEKPTCYCPAEGERLIEVDQKTNGKLQIGNQQRSSSITSEAISMIHSGVIGNPYEARTWYTNQRKSIGKGVETTPPEWLDWDLWQGPAPRKPFRDNIVHYNWHWFKHWGTGEICNNAVHEIDIALWALKKQYPQSVTSQGGRFHYTDDDWEFYDTQLATFKYADDVSIIWDGRSCTNLQLYNRGRGTIIYGTNGSILIDRNGYVQFDLEGKKIKEQKEPVQVDGTNISGEDSLTVKHFANWHRAITQNEKLNAPVEEANVSNVLCHIGNIAQDMRIPLMLDDTTGKVHQSDAMKRWNREYERGWEI